MKINPFKPGNPVPVGVFAGRAKELLQIDKCLLQTSYFSPQNILITGERGIGKTSVSYMAKATAEGKIALTEGELKKPLITAYFSVKKNTASAVVISQIVEELETQLEPYRGLMGAAFDNIKKFVQSFQSISMQGLEIKTKNNQTIPVEEVYIEAKKTLRKCANACRNTEDPNESRSICLIVDEFDSMGDFENFSSFWKGLQETLGADNSNNLQLIFIGMPELRDKLADDHESILRSFTPIHLDKMVESEARAVIEKSLEGSGKTITPEAMKKILDYSERFPHLIQELGYSAFEVSETNEISEGDVEAGVHGNEVYEGSIKRLATLFFSKMYREIQKSDNFKEILKIIADNSSSEQKWVTRQDILNKFSGKKGSLDSSIRTLKDRELIITNPETQGQYRIVSKMFHAYVENLL